MLFFAFSSPEMSSMWGGRDGRSWALVACEIDGGAAQVIGWCRASELVPYLPEDRRGRWMEALVRLPRAVLSDGIPPAV